MRFEALLRNLPANVLSELALIRCGHISDQEIASLYAEDLSLPLVPNTFDAGEVDMELASLLPEKLCTDKLICPMAVRDDASTWRSSRPTRWASSTSSSSSPGCGSIP